MAQLERGLSVSHGAQAQLDRVVRDAQEARYLRYATRMTTKVVPRSLAAAASHAILGRWCPRSCVRWRRR
ncbi:ferredoxin [Catenulispora sp. EB89]